MDPNLVADGGDHPWTFDLWNVISLYGGRILNDAGSWTHAVYQSIAHLRLGQPFASTWVSLVQVILLVTGLVMAMGWWRRYRTRARLVACGLPTVFWRPKFINYLPSVEDQPTLEKMNDDENTRDEERAQSKRCHKKLSSSSITKILPKMERLQGPYGMYGTVYGVSTAVIHVAHPIPAHAILKLSTGQQPSKNETNDKLRRRRSSSLVASCCGASKQPAYDHFKNFCGDGVFTADGDDWREKRAAVMHVLLRAGGGGSYETKVEDEAHRAACQLIAQLTRETEAQFNGRLSKPKNVVPILQRTTIGLIYRYITHADLQVQEVDGTDPKLNPTDRESDKSTNRGVSEQMFSAYLNSITRIRMIILAQSRSIWFLLPRWVYRWFSSMYREEEHTMGPIRNFSLHACKNAQPGSPLAILNNMPLYANAASTSCSKNLMDEAITLLFAGQDTSAATLSWTLHLLSLYPKIQTKLADEIKSVFPDLTNETVLTRKMLSKLTFLDAVIKESMRLYPVAPFIVRRLTNQVEVNDGTEGSIVLPANSLACIWIYSLHRHPQFWSRPDDFVPERWLIQDAEKRDPGITNGAYMPFAVGPRNCVGQPLAHIILRSLLTRLIAGFEFRNEDLNNVTDPEILRKDMQAGFTVLPEGGVQLTIAKREV